MELLYLINYIRKIKMVGAIGDMMRKVIVLGIVIVGLVLLFTLVNFQRFLFLPQEQDIEGVVLAEVAESVVVIAEDLIIPWDIAFLPDGDLLVSERIGRVVRLGDARVEMDVVASNIGEGGLLGLTLHPDFEENSKFY